MTDFINKILTIVLIFVMLVLAPLLNSYKFDESMAKREILNDVTLFIDKAKDTASITEDDLNKLYITCNSHGLAVNVDVNRLIKTDVNKDGKVDTVYYSVDTFQDLQSMNFGDIVKVTIDEVGVSTSRKMMYSLLKIDEGKFTFSLAGTVG